MNTSEKRNLTNIGKDDKFKKVIKKLTLNLELDNKEKAYILSAAILFLREYEKDKRHISYADFAYYIILKYSLKYKDFKPLYDFSTNFGFYPISNALLKNDLVDKKIEDVVIESKIEEFKNKKDSYVETLEQFNQSRNFLAEDVYEKSYIAPTSFGKSSIIEEYIKKLDKSDLKIAIIVPTKSLLIQTYNMIKNASLEKKILIHNEMYNYKIDKTFIGIFTQERALRLLAKETKLFYDVIIIDEAHNMFDGISLKEDDLQRGILLTRLISLNKKRKKEQRVIYLSPLIDNIDNLKIEESQKISSHIINFNIKEPEYFEYTVNNEIYVYNRFINEFYKISEEEKGKFEYIKKTSKNKNFIYETSPKNIENTAIELSNNLPRIAETSKIKNLIQILRREVHPDFYAIRALRSGVIYLHGKIPDIIKEYLEYKFKDQYLSEIKYIVANTVILEGINLPIDNLYIFDSWGLQGKDMTNLIGRVNRLNEIFSKHGVYLNKLLPSIHFINKIEYSGVHNNNIRNLRGRIFKDVIKNPILREYNMEKDVKGRDKYRNKVLLTQDLEKKVLDFDSQEFQSEEESIFDYFNRNGLMNYFYNNSISVSDFILRKEKLSNSWNEFSMMDKINYIFLSNKDNISQFSFSRLFFEETRKYYENYILLNLKMSLPDNIKSQIKYFNNKKESNNPYLYMNDSYSNYSYNPKTKEYVKDDQYRKLVYIRLLDEEKIKGRFVNIAIRKIKIEEDFISYTLTRFIEAMLDFNLISLREYNLYIYGTEDPKEVLLTQTGLSMNLISRLKKAGQLENLKPDKFGNLEVNDKFKDYKNNLDDFHKFEINRYL